uniref:Heat shock protein 70 n=1 Tax=Odontella aurita TaxID=265563 RepID=A0A7S4NBP9_9STRA
MVGFSDSRSMGESATTGASSNYKNTVSCMKRLVGLAYDDPRAKKEMSWLNFACVPIKHGGGGPDSIGVKVQYGGEDKVVSIEAVAGMIVKHMGSLAAKNAKSSSSAATNDGGKSSDDVTNPLFPKDWVIAIPGYYTDSQRRAFLTGCEIAGIEGVQRLMHDTTATALAFGIFKDIKKVFTKEKPSRVMFIDFGHTAYSVSVVEFVPGKLIVKSSQYDRDLGGREFDLLIAEWIAAKFEEKYKGKLSGKPMDRPKTKLKLLSSAEKAKKTLSPAGVREVAINIECLMDDYDFRITLKAPEYEEMCAPLLARLNPPIQSALSETGLKPADFDSVELVGGSTRIGSVKRTLAKILGLDAESTNCGLSTTMNADEAVARGAALQSAILSPRFKVLPYEIAEYQPYPVKIAWDGDTAGGEGVEVEGSADGAEMPSNAVVMFDRGSNFPVVRRVTLRRSGDFVVKASYDESAGKFGYPEGCDSEIATFTVKAPAGEENKIRVNVKEDIHGTILMSSVQMLVEEEVKEDEEMPPADAEKKEGEEGKKKEGEAEEKTKEEKKKTKTKKVSLECTVSRPIEWSKSDKDKANEMEVSMSNADRVVRETADMRNELESYIYDMRDKIISESHLAPFCTDDERSAFSSALETNENWLYEDGFDATKSVYADKLNDLRKLGNPIALRQSESRARPQAVSNLQRAVEKYMNWLNTSEGEDAYAHITYDERSKCYDTCDATSSWMYDVLDKQGSLAQNVDPAVTVADIQKKITELNNVVSPVMHKPKPKPKKEEKKAEEKPKEGEKKEEKKDGEPEPMDTSTDDKPKEDPEPMKE